MSEVLTNTTTSGDAGSVMRCKRQAQQIRERARDPVEERSVFVEWLSGQMGGQPSAPGEHIVDDPEADGVLGLPWIVPEQAREHVGRNEQQ